MGNTYGMIIGMIIAGWWFQPTPKNDGVSSSIGMTKFPTEWNKKHVPNHQPAICLANMWGDSLKNRPQLLGTSNQSELPTSAGQNEDPNI